MSARCRDPCGGTPGVRHKDRGIWQTWTWVEVYDKVRAIALGLKKLGVGEGDKIAIVGANRPMLYWTLTAAQMLRATPVPVYADAIADELAYVLENADVKVAAAQDQEQVDKLLSISDRLKLLTHIVYDEDRGLRDYSETNLVSLDDLMEQGHKALHSEASLERALDEAIDAGHADDAVSAGDVGQHVNVQHGVAEHVGSLQVGRLADCALWQPAFCAVRPERAHELADAAGRHGVPLLRCGAVGGDRFRIGEVIDVAVEEIRAPWRDAIPNAVHGDPATLIP